MTEHVELKPKRRMKLLLLVELGLQEGVEFAENPLYGGLVVQGNGGITAWDPATLAQEIEEGLKEQFPHGIQSDEPWYVKSVKEATAP